MLYFVNDYSHGAHERILQRLMQTNREPLSPYGTDVYTESAKQKIRAACACDDAQIWLLVGGTQTNQVVIDATLSACEGVIAAATGHIASHEAGAIEMTGHKVLTLPHNNGKLDARTVRDWLRRFYADENREHMVSPGMVYISHPTEYGTLYSKEELAALRGSATNIGCRSIWTVPDWAMRSHATTVTYPCPI